MAEAAVYLRHFTMKMAWICWRHTAATKAGNRAKLATSLVRRARRQLRAGWRVWREHVSHSQKLEQVQPQDGC